MKETYHIISKRDLNYLVKNKLVILNRCSNYVFHDRTKPYISLFTQGMSEDIIASHRREFEYESIDLDDDCADDPFLDGISGNYAKWFVPIWCVVEWLKKRGLL